MTAATTPAEFAPRLLGLEGSTAVVTGASQGISLAIAEALAMAGAYVIGVRHDMAEGARDARTAFILSRKVGRTMLERGSGKIVNAVWMLSFQGGINVPGCAASKSANAGLTKALANEWAAGGVNVNAVAPGYVATANTYDLREDAERNKPILDRIPAGQWAEASDIAGAVLFLCSLAASCIHGAILPVSGGWLASQVRRFPGP